MSASSRFVHPAARGALFSSNNKVVRTVKHWMEHHPIASNSFLCLNLWVAGDILAQYSEHSFLLKQQQEQQQLENENKTLQPPPPQTNTKERETVVLSSKPSISEDHNNTTSTSTPSDDTTSINYVRTVQCASYGAIITGPLLAVWYPFLEKLCVRYSVAARYGVWGAPILKVMADELLMDPPTLALFYGYMNLCEGGTLQSFQQKLQSEFWPSWMTSLAVWPVILLGTFRYLPIYIHAPVINVCCIVWDGFLSHRNFLSRIKQQQQQQQEEEELLLKTSTATTTAEAHLIATDAATN
jgi:protein Mpv17